jgi:glutamine synthetase
VPTPQHDAATLDRVLERLRSDGVEFCMATYADGHGIAKCKTVPLDHFHAMMRGSELFTGAALDMLGQSPAYDELAVWPDPDAIVAQDHAVRATPRARLLPTLRAAEQRAARPPCCAGQHRGDRTVCRDCHRQLHRRPVATGTT